MKIEKISKKDNKNVLIEFDNNEKLILNYEVFLKNSLRKGYSVSADRFSFLIDENKKHAVKSSAIIILSKRPHSEKELRLKLLQKKYDKDFVSAVLSELKDKDLLDDHKFASIFTEEKRNSRLWGEKKIKSELIKRGINPEIISQVLSEKFTEEDSLNNAITLAEKKIKSLVGRISDKRKLAERIYSFLSSRGFNYDISKQAIDKVLNETFIE